MKQCKEKLVTTDGKTQVITGIKIITKELLRQSSELDVTTKVPQNTYNTAVRFRDKNNKETGAVNNYQVPDGTFRTCLEARNKDNYVPTIGIAVPFEGTSGGYGYAPNTPAGAPDNAIVTKGYITGLGSTPAMPGYYACPRVAIKSNVWNLAEKNLLVTILCNKDIQGWIYINNSASDTNMAIASACVSPGSGGVSCAQAFIRKGIYFKGIFNNSGWLDELMG